MKRTLLSGLALASSLLLAGSAAAQQRTIAGIVTEQATGAPLSGAQVSVVGTNTGGLTNAQGRFSLQAPVGEVRIRVEHLGFRRVELVVGSAQQTLQVALETDILLMDAIVVTGQATGVAKRNLANAVGTVNTEELNKTPASSIEQMLAGKLAGVNIQQNSGAPGGGSRVRLRGITSIIGPGEPLYVVDGVIVSDARLDGGVNAVSLAAGRRQGQIASNEQMNPRNRITDLNPDVIERVEVLKGASAAAIYGSKASNGVILITTKRGQAGAPQFSIRQGFGTATRAFTFGSRYFQNQEDAVEAFGPQAANHFAPGYDAVSLEDQLSGREPFQFETSATMSGGNDNTRFFASALIRHEPGIVVNTLSDKASFRLNLDQNIGDRLTIQTGAEVIRTKSDRGMFGNDNSGTSYYFVVPHHPNFFDLRPTCPDGEKRVSCGDGRGVYPDNPFVASNPLQTAALMRRDDTVWRIISSGRVNFQAMSSARHNMRISLNGGVDNFTQKFDLFSPPELQFEDDDGLPGSRVLSYAHGINSNINLNLVHTFNSRGGAVQAMTSTGLQFEREELNVSRTAAKGLIGGTPNLGSAVSVGVNEVNSVIQDLGFFAQEELLLYDKLLLTLGGRADRSSANADTDKIYFYPKASASYRVPMEGDILNEIKFRAAFGQTGNRPLFGQKFSNLQTTNVDGIGGLVIDQDAGNVDAKPERQTEFEGGADAQLFNGTVLFEGTIFQKQIRDLLLRRTLAPSTGFTSEIFNGGELKVWGLETTVTVVPIQSESTTWTATMHWSMNRSEVTDLPVPAFLAEGFLTQGAIRIEEGKSATQWVANDTVPGTGLSDNPQVIVRAQGDGEPRWLAGLTSSVQHRSLTFAATVDAQKGGLVNLGTWRHWDGQLNAYDHDEIDPATGIKKGVLRRQLSRVYPRMYSRDASYVKLREVRIAVDLPQNFTQGLWRGIKGARVSLSARNLYTNGGLLGGDFYQGSDPEVANYNSGTQSANNVQWTREFAGYPSSKSFWLNFDVTF